MRGDRRPLVQATYEPGWGLHVVDVNIALANLRTTKDQKVIALFEIQVADTAQLHKVMGALEAKKGVISVERVRS